MGRATDICLKRKLGKMSHILIYFLYEGNNNNNNNNNKENVWEYPNGLTQIQNDLRY